MTPIRAIIFDLGNVLLPFDHGRMVSQLAALVGADPKAVHDDWFGDATRFAEYENGAFDGPALHRMFAERYGEAPFEAFAAAASDIFTPDDAMERLVRDLKAAGYRLVLLSNTSDLHIDFIRSRYAILEPFDELVLSYEQKLSKPDAAIYRVAVERAGCEASECVFVDDRPENVAGAEAAGIVSHRFTNRETLLRWFAERGVADESGAPTPIS